MLSKEILVVDDDRAPYLQWARSAEKHFGLKFKYVDQDAPIVSGLNLLQQDTEARICGALIDSLEEYQETGQMLFSHLEQLLNIRSDLHVAVFSGNRQKERVDRALQLGAVGYFRKNESLAPFFELVTSKKPLPKEVRQTAKSYIALNLGSGLFPDKVGVVDGKDFWRVKVFATSDKQLVGTLKISDDCKSQVWFAQNQLATST